MERTVISFTFENWITVLVMVFVGFALMGAASRLAYRARSGA